MRSRAFAFTFVGLSFVSAACTRPAPDATTTTAVAAVASDEPSSCGGHEAEHAVKHTVATAGDLKAGDEATCVVMNRKFVLEDTTPVSVYDGKTFAFCCDGCKDMFDADPKKYAQLAMK